MHSAMKTITICILFALGVVQTAFGPPGESTDPVPAERGGTYYIHNPSTNEINSVKVEEATVDSLLNLCDPPEERRPDGFG